MTTRRDFLKGTASLAAAAAALQIELPKDESLEIDFQVTPTSTGMVGMAYVHCHATWEVDPMKGPKEWAGGMTVADNPTAIDWAKERLAGMLMRAHRVSHSA